MGGLGGDVRPALLASLPMYDLPEIEEANDALWAAIASRLQDRGFAPPPRLMRGEASCEPLWSHKDLLLSQTCSYPLLTLLGDAVMVVGAPCYGAKGCAASYHRSAIVVPAGSRANDLRDLRSQRCAVNGLASNTGMNLLRAEIAGIADGRPFFSEVNLTGSHVASLEWVASGCADVAAIDAVTLALLRRHRPNLTDAVRVLDWTVRSRSLPLITGRHRGTATLAALQDVLSEVSAEPTLRGVRRELLWSGFEPVTSAQYRPILGFARAAAEVGYPELR